MCVYSRFHGLIYAHVRIHCDLIIVDLMPHIEQGDNDTHKLLHSVRNNKQPMLIDHEHNAS